MITRGLARLRRALDDLVRQIMHVDHRLGHAGAGELVEHVIEQRLAGHASAPDTSTRDLGSAIGAGDADAAHATPIRGIRAPPRKSCGLATIARQLVADRIPATLAEMAAPGAAELTD